MQLSISYAGSLIRPRCGVDWWLWPASRRGLSDSRSYNSCFTCSSPTL